MLNRRCAFIVALSAMTMLLSGCIVTSINPLYFEENVVFKPELLGTWCKKNDDPGWMFEKDERNKYNLTIFDKKLPGNSGLICSGSESTCFLI